MVEVVVQIMSWILFRTTQMMIAVTVRVQVTCQLRVVETGETWTGEEDFLLDKPRLDMQVRQVCGIFCRNSNYKKAAINGEPLTNSTIN